MNINKRKPKFGFKFCVDYDSEEGFMARNEVEQSKNMDDRRQ